MAPFRIFLDGKELLGWTSATLSRKKSDLTGTFSCEVFFAYSPKAPVMIEALRGRDVTVYVGGHLAFFGSLDRRRGKGNGKLQGSTASGSISPDSYTVSLQARGRTKYLVDSSHQHPTGTMKKPTSRQVAEALTKDFDVELDWQSDDVKLDRVVFRDGAAVVTELQRLGNENGHFFYETRDGKLRFTDQAGPTGDDLILGKNIIYFSADQTEEHEKSDIVVKGQRTTTELWGEQAVLEVAKRAKNGNVPSKIPYVIQHYGDGTPEALERRAKFEGDKRTSQSLSVSIDVFHIQTESGEPWDIGTKHYVEIPPEGIFDVLECTELTYHVQNDKTLKTTLTLAPPPSPKAPAATKDQPTSGLEKVEPDAGVGNQKRAQLGVTGMDVWKPADLQFTPSMLEQSVVDPQGFLDGIALNTPPLKLPGS